MYKFQVIAHEGIDAEGSYKLATEIFINAKTAKEAIEKAKKLLKKKDYSIRSISESQKCELPDYTEIFRELIKSINKK